MFDELFNYKLSEIFKLLSILRVDFYVALYSFGLRLPLVTYSQLVQDKYCINTLRVEVSKCLQLGSAEVEFQDLKNQVLAYSTTFAVYDMLTMSSPGIFSMIFFGYWIDAYPNQLKYLLALPALGGCLCGIMTIANVYYFNANTYHLLWKCIPYALTGGAFIVYTGSYTYIARTTKPKYRVIRFAVLDLFTFSANPLATAIAGKLLITEPWISA
ncbi:uncharacterized protein LOC128386747 isoform X2 [Panonychus citri]|uniref:uncharacterized protein LOC128386747 isoform X2 n=1 Tax=Panonychus citri TaxID=50023 RepID=UPI002308291F|nr:uncharacterized protein LOC128386747 isoform X2 [Panonychus citri]